MFLASAPTTLAASYPEAPTLLQHSLASHALLSLEALAHLAARMPAQNVEYNRGDLPVSQDPASTPTNGLSIEETVRTIQENGSWMVLKNVEADPEYCDLLNVCLADLKKVILAKTGAMLRQEAFIFISSPGSITPFHMDPEHNILMQVRGTKTVQVYPADAADILSAEQHEAWHENGHRNLPYQDHYETIAQQFELAAGDALHIPLKAPHWVRNGKDVSISLSITWRSRKSINEAALHRMNGLLRKQGLTPKPAGHAPLLDNGKALTYRMLGKFGLIKM